jgi:hypothetical protein
MPIAVPRGLLLLALAALLTAACAPAAAPEPRPQGHVSYDAALAALRVVLRQRGVEPTVTSGPIVAWPPPDHPDAAQADAPATPDGRSWPEGAWLLETTAGQWWVSRHLVVLAADDAARLAERLADAGSSDGNGWGWRPDD